MTIQNRLDLFVATSMILPEEAQEIRLICSIYQSEFKLDFGIEAAERFITHFVGMYQRVRNQQNIEVIPEVVMTQLITDSSFNDANILLGRLIDVIKPPKEEEGYFLLHLIHYLGQQKEMI
ncbi:MAG: hypothetical protein FD133_1322 [Erysipelotrichaceae bacterium]|nr:MAG: hypothetical protein FD179_1839 [Erysipelotrichaceae bacterium]TXT17560.1 MAG: hypothetical protein FD133_1322 [Erysipelotrichaceae bacterium]